MSLVIDVMPELGVTRLSRWIFNCYVLRGGDGAVVVDAGLPRVAGDLAAVLRRLGGTLHAVVATHGHSDHSIALWNPATRTLLSGDAVLTARGKAWHTPEIVDAASAAATRKRLEELPVAHLLPGHGRPVHVAETVWPQQRR
jgi:glyoxylase-like metal-dependent hydrolase (beta-lactamase superfamily II)